MGDRRRMYNFYSKILLNTRQSTFCGNRQSYFLNKNEKNKGETPIYFLRQNSIDLQYLALYQNEKKRSSLLVVVKTKRMRKRFSKLPVTIKSNDFIEIAYDQLPPLIIRKRTRRKNSGETNSKTHRKTTSRESRSFYRNNFPSAQIHSREAVDSLFVSEASLQVQDLRAGS